MTIESSRLTNKTVGIKTIFDLISIFNLEHCDMNSLHQGTLMNAYKSKIENKNLEQSCSKLSKVSNLQTSELYIEGNGCWLLLALVAGNKILKLQ